MIGWLHDWIEGRRRIRWRWQSDARMLVADARNRRDAKSFWHWSKVTAEVARICPTAEMDLETVKRVVDRELGKR